MKTTVLIVNGRPGSGKDTFAAILGKKAAVKKISIIDLAKEMATLAGWNGLKNDRSRKFLSDLKGLIDEFNDASFCDVESKVISYIDSGEYDYILIDARRLEDIERMKKEFNAFSLYVENNNITHIPTNRDDIDARVNGGRYDITICNNGTIEQFETAIESLNKDLQKL